MIKECGLVQLVSDELRRRKWQLVSAESCTGGLISSAITDLPGSSDVFDRGFITYSNAAKRDHLDVPLCTLENYGAVSRETAIAMAEGALVHSAAQIAVSVTGIAGPSGGTEEKPVGLVYIGVAADNLPTACYQHIFSGDRSLIRRQSVEAAFQHLLETMGTK